MQLAEDLARAAAPLARIRLVVALLSLLVVPATWLLARAFLSPLAALFAAASAATSLLHLWFSQQARPHAVSCAMTLLAVVACIHLRRRGRARDYLVAGAAIALAIGTLQSGLAVLPAFFAAVCLRSPRALARSRLATCALSVAALGIAALGVLAFYPFLFEAGDQNLGNPRVSGTLLQLSGHPVFLDQFRGAGFETLWATLLAYEPIASVLAILGLLGSPWLARTIAPDRERLRDLAVVLAHVVPYALVIGFYSLTFQRFVLPLLPYVFCLAAFFVAGVAERGLRSSRRVTVRLAALAVIVVPITLQAWIAGKLVLIRLAPDTMTRAGRWIRAHVPAESGRVAVMPVCDLPIYHTPSALLSNVDKLLAPRFLWSTYQRALPGAGRAAERYDLTTVEMGPMERYEAIKRDPRSFVETVEGDYLVVVVYKNWGPPVFRQIRSEFRAISEPVARFAPDEADHWHDLPILYQDDLLNERVFWAWRVLQARCVGPVLEVYALHPPAK